MAQYITIHRAPGLSREEVAGNAEHVFKAAGATFRQIYVNLAAGFLVTIFEAESQDDLEGMLRGARFPVR